MSPPATSLAESLGLPRLPIITVAVDTAPKVNALVGPSDETKRRAIAAITQAALSLQAVPIAVESRGADIHVEWGTDLIRAWMRVADKGMDETGWEYRDSEAILSSEVTRGRGVYPTCEMAKGWRKGDER